LATLIGVAHSRSLAGGLGCTLGLRGRSGRIGGDG
jgi:hypothetical protein